MIWAIVVIAPPAAAAAPNDGDAGSSSSGAAGGSSGSSSSSVDPAVHEVLVRVAASKRQQLDALEVSLLDPLGSGQGGRQQQAASSSGSGLLLPRYYKEVRSGSSDRRSGSLGASMVIMEAGDEPSAGLEAPRAAVASAFEFKQLRSAPERGERQRHHCVPASGRSALGLLRRYEVDARVAETILDGFDTNEVDFCIKVGLDLRHGEGFNDGLGACPVE